MIRLLRTSGWLSTKEENEKKRNRLTEEDETLLWAEDDVLKPLDNGHPGNPVLQQVAAKAAHDDGG